MRKVKEAEAEEEREEGDRVTGKRVTGNGGECLVPKPRGKGRRESRGSLTEAIKVLLSMPR